MFLCGLYITRILRKIHDVSSDGRQQRQKGAAMHDFRFDLLDRIGNDLMGIIENKRLYDDVMDIVTIALDGYEVTEMCTDLVPGDTSNEMIIKRYCACLLIDGKSKGTIYQYAQELRRFYLTTGKMFSVVGAYDIRMYLALKKQGGVSNRTLATMRSYLFAFFEWMVAEEMIEKNPCAKIKPIKYQRKVGPPFSDVDIDALRSVCKNNRERALIEILLATGVRCEELSDLKISDINMSDKSVIVRHGKGNKRRVTYLTDLALTYIKKYLMDRGNPDPDEYLFTTRRGKVSRNGVRYILGELQERSGVDNVHPHRFRRTFATSLVNRGMSVQEVQRLMGHADINVTMQYVTIDDARVQNSYKRFSQNI